jgi:hypothetical protein
MKEIEPKILTKEEIERIPSGINEEELIEFDKHALNSFYEALTAIEAKEPGSSWVKVVDKEGNVKEILDATSMNWTLSLGFAHPDVNYAAYQQMIRLNHVRYNVLTPARAKLVNKIIYIDEGARRLGEIALVPHSSPISQTGLLFYNILLDENASNHIAIGQAYRNSLKNGNALTDEEFMAAGGNNSSIHLDLMIGSGEMSVDGVLEDETTEPIMRNGEWVFEV